MQELAEIELLRTARDLDTTRRQIRGSSVLLLGRFLSLGTNFAAQVLIVRYLSTSDYGALAYGLAVVSFLEMFAILGLPEAVSRFVPIYLEDQEYGRLFGTTLFAGGAVAFTGMLIVITVRVSLSHFATHDKLALHLLSILIFLVPVDAADALLDGLFASFASTRDIFFRKYVLGPGLKLSVVLLLIGTHSTATFLAQGYLFASTLGILLYAFMLLRLLHAQGLLQPHKGKPIQIPASEIMSFIVPGLSAVLATAAIPSIHIFLLGYMRTMTDAAYYRAAVPVAGMNSVILASFTLLYTPSVARLFAKRDYININRLYWQTAAWMSVLSFPMFAVTFSLAQPLTVFLYGARYERSGAIVALLSLGSYFNVALGLNLQTLKVLGRLRYVISVSILAAATDIVANLLLIPRYGAIGAAIAAAGVLISYNLLLQIGLLFTANIAAFDHRYLSVYFTIILSTLGLCLVQHLTSLNFYFALLLASCVSLFVLVTTKKKLSITETFPEVLRLPLMRFLFA